VAQLALDLAQPAPRDAVELLDRLLALGLRGIEEVRLTDNRRTMVSVRGRVLRVHRGYLDAPAAIHAAIVQFVIARRGPGRTTAVRAIIEHSRTFAARAAARARREQTHPDDLPLSERLTALHARFNAELFGGALDTIAVRISRRMRSRLGHYSPAREGDPAEIAISRSHFRRHGFTEVAHTLLHEMVHQWQDENGHALDHGVTFRAKAREVGVSPSATRKID
jgi:hypothetical protein